MNKINNHVDKGLHVVTVNTALNSQVLIWSSLERRLMKSLLWPHTSEQSEVHESLRITS